MVADIFSRLDYMERRGSGFKKIMQAYEVKPNYTEDKKPVFNNELLNEKSKVLDFGRIEMYCIRPKLNRKNWSRK